MAIYTRIDLHTNDTWRRQQEEGSVTASAVDILCSQSPAALLAGPAQKTDALSGESVKACRMRARVLVTCVNEGHTGWHACSLPTEENNKYFSNKLFNLVSGINKKVFFTTFGMRTGVLQTVTANKYFMEYERKKRKET